MYNTVYYITFLVHVQEEHERVSETGVFPSLVCAGLHCSRYFGQPASVYNNWRPYHAYPGANFTARVFVAQRVPGRPGTNGYPDARVPIDSPIAQ